MNPLAAFFAGIAPEHVPALLAALLLPVLWWLVRRFQRTDSAHPGAPVRVAGSAGTTGSLWTAASAWTAAPVDRPPLMLTERWAAALLAVSAAVHLALPLGHLDGPLLALGYVAAGAGYAWLVVRVRRGRRWRLPAALLTVATLVAYLAVAGTGSEEPDQVGIATALVELAVLGLALVPLREPGRPRRFARFAGSAAMVTAVVLVGAVVWVGSFLSHRSTGDTQAQLAAGTAPAVGHAHDHGHDHAARAQAGVVMRPSAGGHHPTEAQQRAAEALAAQTRTALARYRSLDAALAAGYRRPGFGATGTDVHLEHPQYAKDGRTLDPQRPETLVYSIMDGRATLLGAMFMMEVAGRAAPEPGGPATRWHAHNLCISLLPPGLGVVSPYGGCSAFAVNITSPEMIHVWVVDNPGGPYADGLDEKWVRSYHAAHALPVTAR